MLASTGNQGTGVERKQPVMRRMELFSWESTWCVKLDRAHTGQQARNKTRQHIYITRYYSRYMSSLLMQTALFVGVRACIFS